jgi:hypothetical protein
MISQNPLIFILDLDGTIIGDCIYQTIIQNIENVAKKNKIRTTLNKQLQESYQPQSKLIRPFFESFITNIRSYFPNSQFYIYTASEKEWATKEINLIEKTHNLKLNRPIFSRNDCILDSSGQYKKSVNKILPMIQKNNKNNIIDQSNIIIIDNNDVFIDYNSNFVLCPSYNSIHFCDAWIDLKADSLNNANFKDTIDKYIYTNKICQYDSTSKYCDEINELRHKWYYKKLKKINSINKKYKNDRFWKKLTNIIIEKKISKFDKQSMEFIRKCLHTK